MRSPTLRLRARGSLACFTRPELKVERVSYSVMTPSAARGLLEAVLWKPAIQWHIERIHVLNEIKFTAFRRNEVNAKASRPSEKLVTNGGAAPIYFADEDRAQRNTVALRDVDYVIDAHFTLTKKAGPDDNLTKFGEMFQRRVEKGQHFHQPYFGCREFVAEVLPPDNTPPSIPENTDLGLMLWDIVYGKDRNTPTFFAARLENGILEVPDDPESTLERGAA
ncbi:MAG: type I-C CRISPR-associated protein Cas5 [Candidatus Latescibacteria bacterium]|nr:type I-C CRISPR-associated protein Cas5 [Candidatus Latescibacterota bacterium]